MKLSDLWKYIKTVKIKLEAEGQLIEHYDVHKYMNKDVTEITYASGHIIVKVV